MAYSERTSRQPRGLAEGVDRALSARAEPRSNPGRSMTRLIHSLLGAIRSARMAPAWSKHHRFIDRRWARDGSRRRGIEVGDRDSDAQGRDPFAKGRGEGPGILRLAAVATVAPQSVVLDGLASTPTRLATGHQEALDPPPIGSRSNVSGLGPSCKGRPWAPATPATGRGR